MSISLYLYCQISLYENTIFDRNSSRTSSRQNTNNASAASRTDFARSNLPFCINADSISINSSKICIAFTATGSDLYSSIRWSIALASSKGESPFGETRDVITTLTGTYRQSVYSKDNPFTQALVLVSLACSAEGGGGVAAKAARTSAVHALRGSSSKAPRRKSAPYSVSAQGNQRNRLWRMEGDWLAMLNAWVPSCWRICMACSLADSFAMSASTSAPRPVFCASTTLLL